MTLSDDKKKFLEKTFDEMEVPDAIQTCLLTGSPLPQHIYFHYWGDLLKRLTGNGFDTGGPTILEILKFIVNHNYSYELINFCHTYWGTTEEAYMKMLNWIESAGFDKMKAAITAMTPYCTAKPRNKAVMDYLLPQYKEELKVLLETHHFKELNKEWFKMLLDEDYDYFEEPVKKTLREAAFNATFLVEVLGLIKDESFIEETMIKNVKDWLKYKSALGTATIETDIIHYLETGEKEKNFDKKVSKTASKMRKWDNRFCDNFLKGFKDTDSVIYKRVFQVGLLFDFYSTMALPFRYGPDCTLTDFAEQRAKHGISVPMMARCLAYEITESGTSFSEPRQRIFRQLLEENLAETLTGLEETPAMYLKEALPLLWKWDREKSFDFLAGCGGDGAKSIRDEVVSLLSGYEPGHDRFLEMTKAKKQTVRETAARLLMTFDSAEDEALLKRMYETDSGSKVKAALDKYYVEKSGDSKVRNLEKGENGEINAAAAETQAGIPREVLLEKAEKTTTKKGKAPLAGIDFLDVPTLPPLIWKEDGTEAPLAVVWYLLKSVAKNKSVAPGHEVKQLAPLFETECLTKFSETLYRRWNMESKSKWVLAFISLFGDDDFIAPMRKQIDDMVAAGRGAMASQVVTAMAYIGSSRALQEVDKTARKIRHKQVKNAAKKAIQLAADELDLTRDDLMDRIVPDFGFSTEGARILDYGARKFTLSLSNTLELTVSDVKEKTFKTMPKPGKNDDKEIADASYALYKTIKKELKEQVKLERERLEDNLSSARYWKKENWENLFVKNPIMHQFALGLIWGVYEKDLKTAFRYMEDGTFNTCEEDALTLPDNGTIGLVHPIELSDEERETWLEQLSDYEITQPFSQLERPVYRVDEDKAEEVLLSDFKGHMISRGSLKNKLFKKNWNRGSVRDAGGFYEYYKENTTYGIGTQLSFFGDFVGYDYTEAASEVPVFDIEFYKAGTVARGSYVYDLPTKENKIPLKNLPPRFYSEIYHEIKTVMASGSGFNPEWKKKEW
ncbi:MAG: DUF4132 domain-containing protein [bacterium]|nr:DUF4132 domain-containing protein [bacterium]